MTRVSPYQLNSVSSGAIGSKRQLSGDNLQLEKQALTDTSSSQGYFLNILMSPSQQVYTRQLLHHPNIWKDRI